MMRINVAEYANPYSVMGCFPSGGKRSLRTEEQYAVRYAGFQKKPLLMVETLVETSRRQP